MNTLKEIFISIYPRYKKGLPNNTLYLYIHSKSRAEVNSNNYNEVREIYWS